MGKALYRAYRSRSFGEVVGQDHVVKTLQNSLKNKAVSHAYLLTGPRGVGKTSIARILAYAVNDLEYQEDIPHLDIIEIDAASNRRIDEVREIRERVRIAPTSAKYKVYIIDEVHMLTREAFNALLKTLEEPPDHAIFILATTELHKVPETIVSRCIRLTFKPINSDVLQKHLGQIAKKEGYTVDNDALELIAEHGRGSFRDGISLLQQVTTGSGKVTKDDVEHMLGIAPKSILSGILAAVEAGSLDHLQKSLDQAYLFGTGEATLAAQLGDLCRELMMGKQKSNMSKSELITLQKNLLLVAGSPKPRTELELSLIDVLLPRSQEVPDDATPPTKPELPVAEDMPSSKVTEHKTEPAKNDSEEVEEPVSSEAKALATKTNASLEHDIWPLMLEALKKRNNTLYGIARMGQVEQTDNLLEITFTFPFHYKQVNESKNKAIFADILKEISGGSGKLSIKLSSQDAPVTQKQTAPDDTLTNVSNIFGTAEMLE